MAVCSRKIWHTNYSADIPPEFMNASQMKLVSRTSSCFVCRTTAQNKRWRMTLHTVPAPLKTLENLSSRATLILLLLSRSLARWRILAQNSSLSLYADSRLELLLGTAYLLRSISKVRKIPRKLQKIFSVSVMGKVFSSRYKYILMIQQKYFNNRMYATHKM